ncbi:MAG: hypothetical protein FWF51_07620 [Chitinivibrionia bacterium]|nr:hypothetical protein [Chitinivibrionia bacterium]
MIIANPIYDATFKRLLENDKTAKFLIGTILDCKVLSLEPTIQEYTDIDKDALQVSLFRKDFAATIETENEGSKRVIIEMRKAKSLGDIYRFKRYLGDEYKKSEFPIISIYVLGFNLSVDSPVFMSTRPECCDLISDKKLEINDDFVEHFTHRAYFIQTLQIKPSFNTKLEKLLSIFEQKNFIGDDETTKSFPFETDDTEMKEMLNVLQYVAADEKTREELSREKYHREAMEGMFGEKDRELAKDKKTIETLLQEKKELEIRNKASAKEMMRLGMSAEKISEITGLSKKEIEAL